MCRSRDKCVEKARDPTKHHAIIGSEVGDDGKRYVRGRVVRYAELGTLISSSASLVLPHILIKARLTQPDMITMRRFTDLLAALTPHIVHRPIGLPPTPLTLHSRSPLFLVTPMLPEAIAELSRKLSHSTFITEPRMRICSAPPHLRIKDLPSMKGFADIYHFVAEFPFAPKTDTTAAGKQGLSYCPIFVLGC